VADPIRQDVTVVRGDDYFAADGRALEWVSSGWPDLTTAAVLFSARTAGHEYHEFGSVVAPTAPATVRVEPDAAETAALLPNQAYEYHVRATLASGHVATLARGLMHVLDGPPAPAPDPLSPPFASDLALWVDDGSAWWLDAAGTQIATAEGAGVVRADDRSGGDRHLTNPFAPAGNPTLRRAVQGGRRVLRFNGTDQSLEALFPIDLVQPWTLLLVARSRSAADNTHMLCDGFNAVSGHMRFSAPNTFSITANVPLVYGSPVDAAAWHVLQGVFNGANSKVKVDAGPVTTGNSGSNTNAGGITLARRGSTTLLWCDCDIGLVLVWSRALSDAELAEAAAWANARWDVF
jgi:hypothetical protein